MEGCERLLWYQEKGVKLRLFLSGWVRTITFVGIPIGQSASRDLGVSSDSFNHTTDDGVLVASDPFGQVR